MNRERDTNREANQGQTLTEILAQLGLSQTAAAKLIGVPLTTFCSWVNGVRTKPRLTLEQEARLFELTGRLAEDIFPALLPDKTKERLPLKALLKSGLAKTAQPSPAQILQSADIKRWLATLNQQGVLTQREYQVIDCRFFQGLLLKDCIEVMGLKNKQRVKQIQDEAIEKLKHPDRRRYFLEMIA